MMFFNLFFPNFLLLSHAWFLLNLQLIASIQFAHMKMNAKVLQQLIQIMEKDRKLHLEYSAIVVLVGYLMSSSLSIYKHLPQSYFAAVPSNLWLLTLTLVLLAYLLGFAQYFFTKGCSFLLQICEYILLPLSVIALVQRTDLYTSKQQEQQTLQRVEDFSIFSIIIILTLVKIFYTNQTFPGESEKQILQFDRTPRVYRVVKLCLNCIFLLLLDESNLLIIRIILNCIDFAIILKSITYIKLELQQVLLLANFNNLLSICAHNLIHFDNALLTSIVSELFLFLLFLTTSNPLKFIIEFKCLSLFQNPQVNRNHFKKKDSKQIIMLFLSCFNMVYDLNSSKKLVLKTVASKKWSTKFIQKLFHVYRILLNFYLEEISQNCIGSRKNPGAEVHQSQLSQILKRKYLLIYGKSLTELEILQDRDLFFNFIAFCMDQIDGNEIKTLPWSYSNEFFLTLISKLSFNFLMKKSLYFYQRLTLKDESITYKTRNKKAANYLKHYKKFYQIKITPIQHYMNFERLLGQFKDQIFQICNLEIKIVQTFGDVQNSFRYLENLQNRQKYKKKITSSIEKCFSFNEYLHFEEFTYLYLLFKVIFCKSIYQTSQEIYEKFIIPKKENAFLKNHVSKIPIVVTCALQSQNKNFGEIIMTNAIFRKKFGVCGKENLRQKKISDLIVVSQQKSRHLQLMLQSSKFSEVTKVRSDHSLYQCFLKVNLQHYNFHIFKEFKITTAIAHSFEESLYFTCKIEQVNNKSYVFSSESAKISRNSRHQNREEITHTQLNNQMHLITIENSEIQNLCATRDMEDFDLEDSLHVHYSVKEDNMSKGNTIHKFTKIQNKIWEKNWQDDLPLLKFSCLTILMCCSAIFLAAFTITWCRSFKVQSKQIQNQILDFISNIQASPLHLSLDLAIKSKIDSNELASDGCMSQIPNLLEFVKQNSNYWVNQQFNQYFQKYPFYKQKLIPILSTQFWSSLNVPKDDDVIDISNYLSIMASLANQYLNTNLASITPGEKEQLIHYISNWNSIEQSSTSSRLLNGVTSLTENRLKTHQIQINVVYMAAVILISVSIFFLFVFLLRAYWEYLQYFELQSKIGSEYLSRRSQEVKFITKQIEQMKNYLTECSFTSNFSVSFQSPRGKKVQQQILSLNELQKLIQPQEYELVGQNHKYDYKDLFLTILAVKKFAIATILLSLVVLVVTTTLNGHAYNKISENSFNFVKILKQGEQTREHMKALISSNWIKHLGHTGIRSEAKNRQIFERSSQALDRKSFILTLIMQSDQFLLQETAYLNLCKLINNTKNNMTTYETCMKELNGFSDLEISPLITIMLKNEDLLWGIKDSQLALNGLCKSTKLYFLYLQPAILGIWHILNEKMNTNILARAQLYLLVMCCGAVAGFLSILREICVTYYSVTQVLKFQIFTMDTAQDLYTKPDLRPYLNRMYYRELSND